MTEQILDQITKQFSLDRRTLSCALFGGGISRSPQEARRILFVFTEGHPFCVAKWYSAASEALKIECSQLEELNKVFEFSPRHLGMVELNSNQIAIETYLKGSTIEDLLCKRLISIEQAIKSSADVFDELYLKTNLPSNEDALNQEVQSLLRQLDNLALENKQWFIDSVMQGLQVFCGNRGCVTSIVHFDFIPRNIILVDKVAHLFDFEFSKRSHLAICDWFRLFMYSPGLMRKRVFAPGLISELILEHPLPGAFAEGNFEKREIIAASIVTYLIDFQLQSLVCPEYALSEAARNLSRQLEATYKIAQALL